MIVLVFNEGWIPLLKHKDTVMSKTHELPLNINPIQAIDLIGFSILPEFSDLNPTSDLYSLPKWTPIQTALLLGLCGAMYPSLSDEIDALLHQPELSIHQIVKAVQFNNGCMEA